jgi:hypothetical protein
MVQVFGSSPLLGPETFAGGCAMEAVFIGCSTRHLDCVVGEWDLKTTLRLEFNKYGKLILLKQSQDIESVGCGADQRYEVVERQQKYDGTYYVNGDEVVASMAEITFSFEMKDSKITWPEAAPSASEP